MHSFLNQSLQPVGDGSLVRDGSLVQPGSPAYPVTEEQGQGVLSVQGTGEKSGLAPTIHDNLSPQLVYMCLIAMVHGGCWERMTTQELGKNEDKGEWAEGVEPIKVKLLLLSLEGSKFKEGS